MNFITGISLVTTTVFSWRYTCNFTDHGWPIRRL